MLVSVEGRSGVRWALDDKEPAITPRRGTSFIGWEEENPEHRVWVQRVPHGDIFDDDREHLERAHEIGQLPAISSSPCIVRVLDLAEAWDTYLIQELAGASLDEVLAGDGLSHDELGQLGHNLHAALATLHELGLVHSDVQPSNVLKVNGTWKLADLGACTQAGEPLICLPRDRRFVRPDVDFGQPASPGQDFFGLGVILKDAGVEEADLPGA